MVSLVLATGALAQTGPDSNPLEDPVATDEERKVLQPIQVTGYHIKRIDLEGPAPVVVFDREDLEGAGINTLEEFARYLPINKPEPPLRFNTVGAAVFDLRGIGVDTTLTLVNGMRVAPYAQSAENYIDVNSIPVSAIERVE
ncbi:MAG: TonB-dependent receptor plug domain-containing protein, partial [Gammaproteobacteria bacterium]|nr:TonB-dependent receptor plug domain-containing protein [Gammaproteobacteria bacterium]